MSLGAGAYKVGGAGQCSSMRRRYPWQPCKQPPPGTMCHTEQFRGILTNQYLLGPDLKREEGMGKNSTKWQISNKLLRQHFAKNRKQATAYASHQVTLLGALGHP